MTYQRLLPEPAILAGCFLAMVSVVALLAPWITPDNPLAQHLGHALQLPTTGHLLGTDDFGRDILSRLMLGARISMAVGFGSALLAMAIGTPAGLAAGYRGGAASALVMRCSDVLLAFPAVLLAMLVATVLRAGLPGVILATALVSVPGFVRLAYAVMLSQRNMQYVEAAVAFGGSSRYVIFRSVLPNVLAPLAVQTAFTIANAVLLEAGLSFLGLGIQPPAPSLGLMLQEARGYLRADAWFGICPGVLLILIVLSLNALADGIGRRVDPRSAAGQRRAVPL